MVLLRFGGALRVDALHLGFLPWTVAGVRQSPAMTFEVISAKSRLCWVCRPIKKGSVLVFR